MPADDAGSPPAADDAEDADDEGLLDVSFPMAGDAGDSDPDDAPPSPRAGDDGGAAAAVDEGAALRCMGLSVDAHVRGSRVEEFKPVAGADPPTTGPGPSGREDDNVGGSNGNENDEKSSAIAVDVAAGKERGWRPASLPLPSWAKDCLQ